MKKTDKRDHKGTRASRSVKTNELRRARGGDELPVFQELYGDTASEYGF